MPSSEPVESSKVVTHADLQTVRPPPASQGSESREMEGLVGVVIGDTRIAMREDEDRRATELRLVRQAQAGDLVAF